jgi:hypothetical protein
MYTAVVNLQRRLGLPAEFFFLLVEESPWSFVIKLHALFESAVTHLLETAMEDEGLREFAASLNLGGQFGKLGLAQRMRLLKEQDVRFIHALGAMRNACVHDIKNVDFSFEAYLDGLARQQQAELIAMAGQWYAPDKPVPRMDGFDEGPGPSAFQYAMFMLALSALADLYMQTDIAELVRGFKKAMVEEGSELINREVYGDTDWINDLDRKDKS